MNVLVTGAGGFLGKNLCRALENIQKGSDRAYKGPRIDLIYRYEKDDDPNILDNYCRDCGFVFHLAGVNRSADKRDFYDGNAAFTRTLLQKLRENGNACPVMAASSVQATLAGRYDGDYGRSKLEGEKALFEHNGATGAKTLVYRFPNLFGKWGRPSYNSVVATFCHNAARGLPLTVTDSDAEIELAYIDDVIDELKRALSGGETRCDFDSDGKRKFSAQGRYCTVPVTEKTTVGEIARLIESFAAFSETLTVPAMPEGSLVKKLYSTFLSYLPPEKAAVRLNAHRDERGSFTEILKMASGGQMSVNVSLPGVTKGQHWHNSKWEIFVTVSGEGLIRQRCVGCGEIYETRVSGENPVAVRMLPGYTHSIVNLSDDKPLVTLMWANERFDADAPDTYYEKV